MIKMRIILCLLVLFVLYLKVNTSRILAVFPTPSISHQVVFRPLIHELSRRGHDVTVITTDPAYSPGETPTNLTEIDVHDLSYKLWKDEFFKAALEKQGDMNENVNVIFKTMLKITASQLKTKEVQDIIKKKKGEFDLLLLEAYVEPALIYSHFFNVPVILISSFGGMPYNLRTVGVSTHPFLYPSLLNLKIYNLTKWEKLQHLYNLWRIENSIWQFKQQSDKTLKSLIGSDIPSLQELSSNVHMLFLNVHSIWVDNQPVPPNVVYIGGIHMAPQKELPKDLKSFLDSSKNGVVYFSLGTNVKTSALPPEIVQMFVRVFSELPFDVLWKWDVDALRGQTKNIKIMKWLPQTDVLRHPNIKLFITQGGLQSTDEAISAGVPLIGIPLLGDQWYNVQKYVHHQIGIQLDIKSLTEEELTKAIHEVIKDKRYRENIIRMRTVMLDQPQSPLERAVWWTEHVLRHGGATHLRAAGANVSWAQYLELELILIVLITLFLAFTVLSISVYVLWRFIRQNINVDVKQKVT
ncbi:unnamed protein product [Euphydryas editha]|uniref:UDP-glucuronosyltransferase n=1 Tax=Euphydryas editha TaxID=104508 RepID=A0AAU9UH60_EUPED|nr:unnamed protein product [Euphydryas editha]